MNQNYLPDRLKARCPLDGCDNVVRIHKSIDDDFVTFSCEKHGDRMRIRRTAGNADKIAKLLPELPISPYKGFLPAEFLLHFMTFPKKSLPRKIHIVESKRIATVYVKQFCEEMLAVSAEKLRKQRIMRAWDLWFKDHYYAGCINHYLLFSTMRELGYVDDYTNKYILCTCFKGE
jgi:hypothetical protein